MLALTHPEHCFPMMLLSISVEWNLIIKEIWVRVLGSEFSSKANKDEKLLELFKGLGQHTKPYTLWAIVLTRVSAT